MTTKPRAYSYIRFSSPEQAKGDSYRRQQAAAKRFCEANGLELAQSKEYTFFDQGKSAFTAKHLDDEGQLKRFNDLVDTGDIAPGSYLLVESLDRLSREKVQLALPRFLDLLNKGIKVVTLTDNRVYDGQGADISTDLIISITLMMRGHEESSTKSVRVGEAWKQKKKEAREKNKPRGRACPAWLTLEEDGYQLNPERVDVIKQIFHLTINGHGQALIPKMLNERGIKPFGSIARNPNQVWSASSVAKLLNNRALIGEYQPTGLVDGKRVPEGEPIADYYPAAITADTFYQAQEARSLRRVNKATKQGTTVFNIWQGVAKCYKCGSPIHWINKGKPPKGGTYLQCYEARKGNCTMPLLRTDIAELAFREILTKVDSLSLVQESAAAIRKALSAKEGELQGLSDRLQGAIEGNEAYPSLSSAKTVQRLENEHQALVNDIEKLRGQLAADAITDKADFLSKLDLVSREGRNAANALLKRLGLVVHISYSAKRYSDIYLVVENTESDKPLPCGNSKLLFSMGYSQGKVDPSDGVYKPHADGPQLSVTAMRPRVIAKQVAQGELSKDDARYLFIKENGYEDSDYFIPVNYVQVMEILKKHTKRENI